MRLLTSLPALLLVAYPNAAERCDGVDNDCDGVADEDLVGTWYADTDADAYGSDLTITACTLPEGYAATPDDCDDTNPAINPAAIEVCDTVDQDCDGSADEGFCIDISNVDPSLVWLGESPLVVTVDTTVDTTTGEITGIRADGTGLESGIWFDTVAQETGPVLGVFSVAGLEIGADATLTVTGANALVVLSSEDALIEGYVDLGGGGAVGWILVRYLSSWSATGTFSPTSDTSCAVVQPM